MDCEQILNSIDLKDGTFDPDESRNSLQSALVGNWKMDNSTDAKKDELTTINEESASTSSLKANLTEDKDFLNVNIDALEEDEIFFDCPNYSPQYSPKITKIRPPSFTSADTNNTSSGVYSSEEQTGNSSITLAEIAKDFDNMRDEVVRSTPNIARSHGDLSKNLSFKRRISFSSEDNAEKEKTAKPTGTNNENNALRNWQTVRRVMLMKAFFESKINEVSAGNGFPKKTSNHSEIPRLVATFARKRSSSLSRSPPRKSAPVPKLKISPVRQARKRPSSCSSNYQCELSEESNSGRCPTTRTRSQSDSDVFREVNNVAQKMVIGYGRVRTATSKKQAVATSWRKGGLPASETQLSKIHSRRSVAMQAKSPIKPVSQLRQVYSPISRNNATGF